jgi:hypothetical protein
LIILSFLYALSVGIFNAIGGIIFDKHSNKLIGCDTPLSGILKLFENIDEYMILSHSIFCSSLCKCNLLFSLKDVFSGDYFYKDVYPNLEVNSTTDPSVKFNINDCPDGVLNIIQKIYNTNPNNTYGIHITDFDKFHKYWKKMESRFKCTGWCRTKYINPFTLNNDTMIKYVFNNINDGIVQYPGCLNRIINYIPYLVGSIGALLIVVGVLQVVSLIFASFLIGEIED